MINNNKTTSNSKSVTDGNQNQSSYWKFVSNVGLILCCSIAMYSAIYDKVTLNSAPFIIYGGMHTSYYWKVYQNLKNRKNLKNLVFSGVFFILFIALFIFC